jgi:5,10-methylenetetrahydromethanopterin reductase
MSTPIDQSLASVASARCTRSWPAAFGVMFPCAFAPEELRGFAVSAEAAGFDELWIVEDCFFAGGLTTVASALAWTDHITVGLGIVAAVMRNPAVVAMEAANLERLFPGRLHLGIGHGVADWMRQIGAAPASWLGALEETTTTVRSLLHGNSVTFEGSEVQLRDVKLVHPPAEAPPVSLGVRKAKSVALAGRVADGVILSEHTSPSMVATARASVGPASRITVYVFAAVDRAQAEERVAATFALWHQHGAFGPIDHYPEPAELVISGPRSTWRTQAQAWYLAGADSVVLVPFPGDEPSIINTFADSARATR